MPRGSSRESPDAAGAGMEIHNISFLQARSIRGEVLRPCGPESDIAYPGDAGGSARHFGAFDGDKLTEWPRFYRSLVPMVRKLPRGAHPPGSRSGVGGQLLQHGIARALTEGVTVIWRHGRTTARAFYECHGFRAVGEEFVSPISGPHYLFVLRAGWPSPMRDRE